jgi:signal transduction histidine kinase
MRLLPPEATQARDALAEGVQQATIAVTEGREAVQGLRESITETNDLAEAIRAVAQEVAAEVGDEAAGVDIEVQGAPRTLHPIVRDEIFRIAGEALRNAFRHAKANKIEVEIRYDVRHFRLRVRDDGAGIDPAILSAGHREGHFGLRGMHERANLSGGNLALLSATGVGTEVDLTIPASRAYATPTSVVWPSQLARRMFGKTGTTES